MNPYINFTDFVLTPWLEKVKCSACSKKYNKTWSRDDLGTPKYYTWNEKRPFETLEYLDHNVTWFCGPECSNK